MENAPTPPLLRLAKAAELRADGHRLRLLRQDPAARVLAVWRGCVPLDEAARPVLAGGVDAQETLRRAGEIVFLGLLEGAPLFAADVSALPGDDDGPEIGLAASFTPLRRAISRLRPEDWALLGSAVGLMSWHRRSRYCGTCGRDTEAALGGWERRCTGHDCEAEHFPRTDPAVIMLVEHDGKCLLGRQHGWPSGMYSCLAGFVEPGETLEEALAREVHEEVGLALADEPDYVASQPWPFPASLMIGFRARAASEALRIDEAELQDAGWFSREDVADLGNSGRFLAAPGTLARRLIDDWLTGS